MTAAVGCPAADSEAEGCCCPLWEMAWETREATWPAVFRSASLSPSLFLFPFPFPSPSCPYLRRIAAGKETATPSSPPFPSRTPAATWPTPCPLSAGEITGGGETQNARVCGDIRWATNACLGSSASCSVWQEYSKLTRVKSLLTGNKTYQ